MNTTIRGHNLRARVVMPLLAVLLLLAVVFAVWPAVTTSDRDANPPSARGAPTAPEGQAWPKIPSTVTSKWSSAWAMAAFGKDRGEGERESSTTWT